MLNAEGKGKARLNMHFEFNEDIFFFGDNEKFITTPIGHELKLASDCCDRYNYTLMRILIFVCHLNSNKFNLAISSEK